MDIVRLLLGAVVLFFGRKLFWLFVGIAGFLFGMEFGTRLISTGSDGVLIAVAVATGLVGVVLAVFAQKLAFGLAGFFAASYFLTGLLQSAGNIPYADYFVLAGGVVGGLVALFMMDWGLVALSAPVGAMVVSEELTAFFRWSTLFQVACLATIFFIGLVFQAALLGAPKTGGLSKKPRS